METGKNPTNAAYALAYTTEGIQMQRTVKIRETVRREIFTTSDGRILGNEITTSEWYEPFGGTSETTFTEGTTGTAAFRTLQEGQNWVEELRNAQAIASAAAFEERIRTEPELRKALQIVIEDES